MKKIMIVMGVVLALIVIALVAIPFFVPVEAFKPRIAAAVKDATGRSLAIDGEISLSLLPRVALTVENVAFENASWAGEKPLAELKALDVRVDPFGLLSGDLRIESFVLTEPTIRLSVARDGRQNWVLEPMVKAPQQPAEEAAPDNGGAAISGLTLGDVRIIDGLVIYSDLRSQQQYEVSKVNVSVSAESLEAPFAVDGSFSWNEKTVSVSLEASRLGAFVGGGATELDVAITSDPLNVRFDGDLKNAAAREMEGNVSVDVPSIKGAAAWAGSPIDMRDDALERFSLTGRVQSRGDVHNFTADSVVLDKIEAEGRLAADLSGRKPNLQGQLDVATLDVTPYLPPPSTQGAKAQSPAGGKVAASGWSEERLDISGLNALNADFVVTAANILIRDIEIGRSELALKIVNGVLTADLRDFNLYGGNGRGTFVVDGSGNVPVIREEFSLTGVDAEPLLTDAAEFERLSGTAATEISLTARGRSQAELVRALSGEGRIAFVDGAIKGINVAAMVRNVTTAFTNIGSPAQKTDFAQLSGTFTVTNGLLRNDDLLLLNPLVRVRGSGTVDIPSRTVDYRLTPKAVASLEGQGAEAAEEGIGVPVLITGPWSDLSARPDLSGVVRDIATDPGKAAESAKGVLEGLKEGGGDATRSILESLGGAGRDDETGGDGVQPAPDPGDALKKLFGN